MKKVILSLFVVTLFSCSKKDVIVPKPIVVTPPPVVIKPTPNIPIGFYVGKTSYELKTAKSFINIDSLRNVFGIKNIGKFNGTNNLGFVYVDMNNDGFEDIFYPYSSNGEFNTKPDVFLFNGTTYTKDNSMLPNDYIGNQNTRKTIIGDFNNDSLPDLFLINHGYEDVNYYPGEKNTLLLSDKSTGKYKVGNITTIEKAFWHGGASGDLNGDGNLDIILLGSKPAKVLYGDGNGNFNVVDWKYNAGYGYITAEIIDVDKDGQNDIILSGDEGKPTPALYSKSTIFFNNNNEFSKQVLICEPNLNGWGYVMDIAVEDIDNDGVKEVFLCRTQDNTGIWYNGYTINIYKKDGSGYKDITETFIRNNRYIANRTGAGLWMYQMHLKKEMDGLYSIYGYVTEQSKIQYWKQNPTTKIFN